MSDAVFYEMLSNINNFSLAQRKSLLKALRASFIPSFHFKKKSRAKDLLLTESLVGVAGTSDISMEQIKAERLA